VDAVGASMNAELWDFEISWLRRVTFVIVPTYVGALSAAPSL
jgi:hypothetical protein